MTNALHGFGVLITRPVGQAARLEQSLRATGAEPLLYPTIEIADTDSPLAAQKILASLHTFDRAIFISANAVEKTFALLKPINTWPQNLPAAAIGATTAQALHEHGIDNALTPKDTFDSEALLALPEFQSVKNSRIVIFRGQGGRETLRETLTLRGAEVTYCETYRRIKPTLPDSRLSLWLEQKKIHAIDIMSAESLANLLALSGEAQTALKKIPLITHHPRVAQIARDTGFALVLTCLPDDAALLAVLESLSLGKLT
jgi:uroporphyrinogen-III synthase